MKNYLLHSLLAVFIGFISNLCFSQNDEESEKKSFPSLATGVGLGIDFGGIGAKVEFLPFKYGGIFGGGGFNLDKLAYDYGAFLRTSLENLVNYFVTGMYGYNGVIIIPDFPQYNRTTIGTSFGAGFLILSHCHFVGNVYTEQFLTRKIHEICSKS